MRGLDFKRWALEGIRGYGEDPWFFLRELAQNARDAGATRIDVRAHRSIEGMEELTFVDNGRGMTFEVARRFFFRLYSSNKEGKGNQAGMFGIGFWSVLRFEPVRIKVDSHCRKGRWAVELDERFEPTPMPSELVNNGTRIVLHRRPRFKHEPEFQEEVEKGLLKWCRDLRQATRRSLPLKVFFNGAQVSRDRMELDTAVAYSFSTEHVEGVVGLGDSPQVTLLARGLPVWEGHFLDELAYNPKDVKWKGEGADDIAPVFLLNGNRLDVVMSRNAVVDNRHLAEVREAASKALQRLVDQQFDSVSGESLWQIRLRRVLRTLGRSPARLKKLAGLFAVLLLLATALFFWDGWRGSRVPETDNETAIGDSQIATAKKPPPPVRSKTRVTYRSLAWLSRYSGAVADPPVLQGALPTFSYRPQEDGYLKLISPNRWSDADGFVSVSAPLSPWPKTKVQECAPPCFELNLELTALKERVNLPVFSGTRIHPASVNVEGSARWSLQQSPSGDPVLRLDSHATRVSYQCSDSSSASPSTVFANGLPDPGTLPSSIAEVLQETSNRTTSEIVLRVSQFVSKQVTYDNSPKAVERFSTQLKSHPWVEAVLLARAGDCDVLNGLATLLLQLSGVPARLAVGYVGKAGRIVGGLHAWVEYFDGGWQILDLARTASIPETIPYAEGSSGRAPVSPASAKSKATADIETIADSDTTNGAKDTTKPTQSSAVHVAPIGSTKPKAKSTPPPAVSTENPYPALFLLNYWPWAVASAVLLLLLLVLRRLQTGRFSGSFRAPEESREAEELLVRVLRTADKEALVWRHASDLNRRPVLPVLHGPRISLERARRLGSAGGLFLASLSNPLVQRSQAVRRVTLDRDRRRFASLIQRIPGVIDLDRLLDMNPQFTTDLLEPIPQAVFDKLEALLKEAGLGTLRFAWTAHTDASTLFVNFPQPPAGEIPSRFVLVPVRGEAFLRTVRHPGSFDPLFRLASGIVEGVVENPTLRARTLRRMAHFVMSQTDGGST